MAIKHCNVQVVLVVGGTSGINRGIAEHFAELGAKVAVLSRRLEKVQETMLALTKKGAAEVDGKACDVRDYEALQQAIASFAQKWGEFDVVISGAAGNFPALAEHLTPNGFRSVVDIDLLGSFHVARAIYPYLKKPGASLIHISAPQAQLAMPGQAHVCAAKAGVDMLTKTLALEWGGVGVRVNAVVPGPVADTEGMARLAATPALKQLVVNTVPLKRMGQAQDIAYACAFLASEKASFITGVILPVDGGWLLGGVAEVGAALGKVISTKEAQA